MGILNLLNYCALIYIDIRYILTAALKLISHLNAHLEYCEDQEVKILGTLIQTTCAWNKDAI